MELYTINATPVRVDVSQSVNKVRVREYPKVVSGVLLKHGFLGFTIRKVMGYWEGIPEVSFEISVATDDGTKLVQVAEELRDSFNQDSVMFTTPDRKVVLI